MTAWSDMSGEPSADMVGPFPLRPFLEVWARHVPTAEVAVIGSGRNQAAVVEQEGAILFAGAAHLTDYHSPLGPDPVELGPALVEHAAGRDLVLDSLPLEAADPIEKGLIAAGVSVERHDDEACMILDLESAETGWEAVLRSKDRHEVRRKRRRFEESCGPPVLDHAPEEFGRFVDLHRSADGDKGGFMTDAMARFFQDLLASVPGARLDVLRGSGGGVVAAGFGFEDSAAYYLYNSAFDPAAFEASPGIVLVDRLIQQTADAGRVRFDFLKGGETYKRRMGAVERPLYRLEVRR